MSTCGLFFSATTLASASPDENRMKFTLTPVSAVKASKTWDAYFSGMMVYAFKSEAKAPDARTPTSTTDAMRILIFDNRIISF